MQSSVAFCGISATFPKAACCWQQQCHKFYIPCPSVLKITFEKKQNCILIWRILSEGAVLTVEVLLIIMLTIFLFLHLFSVFKNTPLTFPHCLYLAHAISEVSANAKLNAPRYLISLSFQMKAGVHRGLLNHVMFSEVSHHVQDNYNFGSECQILKLV